MSDFHFLKDMEITRDLLGMSVDEFAHEIGISRMTFYRWREGKQSVSPVAMARFYDMAFRKGLRLNKIKEQFYKEDYTDSSHVVLFHGAKRMIEGKLDIGKSRKNNDFGQGFYCGESMEQSVMFVSNFPESSLYIFQFDKRGLKKKEFHVDREWMLTIAYFRGRLNEFENSPMMHELSSTLTGIDYIVAPIADNRMFEIIDSFIDGEITDIQCQHCLSATNLGNQHVFVSPRALEHVQMLEHCFLASAEKTYYLASKRESNKMNRDKVNVARKQYRGQGKYIDEILKNEMELL